MEYSGFI